MNLTYAQKATIEYFGLEVVETNQYRSGDLVLCADGEWFKSNHDASLSKAVVVRPRHAARIAELEAEVARLKGVNIPDHPCKRPVCTITIDELRRQLTALEAELAPVRALKVGSWQWAMVQWILGNRVIDRHGTAYRVDVRNAEHAEPFTLYTPPEPEPTAAELAAAILAWTNCDDKDHTCKTTRMIALAARVKRKEGGDGR